MGLNVIESKQVQTINIVIIITLAGMRLNNLIKIIKLIAAIMRI